MFFSRLSWLDGSGLGFSLEYPTISLHAVSRDLNAYPREHLYVMVNAKFGEESRESLSDEEDEDSDDDVEPIAEFRFVPSDKSACECSTLLIFSLYVPSIPPIDTHTSLTFIPVTSTLLLLGVLFCFVLRQGLLHSPG
uniref:Methylosome subunit pICln n=1 Tax=Castor canadensis TaxID=51338 RepID=A0A8C0X8L5_CASCN